ncbi:lysylphosphatidylglycerol synthase domain-containing protein [Demequina sp. NBRC 110054]|uniref:lysylphosphatidylglycerol synthase domain-containing protein n=1 Tax=Demequina sp. NBRC 110054 TaxID=1570343 RepID=UPI000A00836C|nr:lysylphosphatidylglycerol synthase domain-containing protein [Demequina sp. NBRC 110054]
MEDTPGTGREAGASDGLAQPDRTVRPRGWKRLVRPVFYLAIVVAFGWFVATVDWSELSDISFEPWWILASALAGLAFRYLGVLVWRVVLVRLGADALPPFRVLASVYSKAWLARYIPGTIPWIAGKIYLAAEHGISKTRLAVSSLVEAASQVVAVGAVSLTLLALDPRIGEISVTVRVLVAVGAVAGFVAMAPPIFNRLLDLAMRAARRGTPVQVGWPTVRDSIALYGGGALLSGLQSYFLILAIAPQVGLEDMLYIIGAIGLGGVVGMLTPLVPSGLGTKDATQFVLLLVVMPAATATLVVVLGRVLNAVVDLLFWLIAVGWEKARAARA